MAAEFETHDGVVLVNSREKALQYPDTWEHPAVTISLGDYVKIGLEGKGPLNRGGAGGERFWVKVVEVLTNDQFVGELANVLVFYDIALGSLIEFTSDNVMEWMPPVAAATY